MRVAFYTYTLAIGGAETIVVNYLLGLKKRGVEVVLIEDYFTDSMLSKKLSDNNIPIINLLESSKNTKFGKVKKFISRRVISILKLNRAVSQIKPDILHFHGYLEKIDLVNFPPKKMIYTFHSDISRNISILGNKRRKKLKSLAEQGMHFCVLNSSAAIDVRNEFDTDEITVIPNGIEIEKIANCSYSREQIEETFGIAKDAYLVGTVGRMHPVKNHERLIDIFKSLSDINPNSCLVVIGGDVNGRRDILQKKVEQYGLSSKVFLLGEKDDATSIMGTFDVFVLPSLSECLPLVAIEAQVLGVKTLLSDVVSKDVVCNENCGYFSLSESNSQIAEKIIGTVTNYDTKPISIFDINSSVEKLLLLYKSLQR